MWLIAGTLVHIDAKSVAVVLKYLFNWNLLNFCKQKVSYMLVTLKESDAFGIPHVSDLYYMIQDVSVWKDKFQLLGDTVSFLIATCEDQVAHELKERYLRISGRWEDLFQVRDLANIETDSLLCHRSWWHWLHAILKSESTGCS